MLLLIAPPGDVLANQVRRHASARGLDVCQVDVQEICSGKATIEPDGRFRGCGQDPQKVSGALLRLQPSWWRSIGCESLGQEPWTVIATWHAAVTSLQCPVLNRFGLSWWAGEPSYTDQLRSLLSSLLKHAPGAKGAAAHVYVAGPEVFAAPEHSHLVEWARRERTAIARWQEQTGIIFARISCAGPGHAVGVSEVDPLPQLHDVPEELTSAMAAALVRILKRNGAPPATYTFF